MVTAGIDVGAKNVKILFLKGGKVIFKKQGLMSLDRKKSVTDVFEAFFTDVGMNKKDIDSIVATGAGAGIVDFANKKSTIVACDARGIISLNPSVRTVIDVGANEARAIRCDAEGRVSDFAVNEKCAAGSGAFVEAMARAMEVSLDEFAELSLSSEKSIPINAQCAIFAESEVVSLIHEETDRKDICRAVHDAMAQRIASMARRVRIEPEIAFIGGVALNKGMVHSLENELASELQGREFYIPEDPAYIGALGAAIIAAE